MKFSLCVVVPEAWGRYVKPVVIGIIVLVLGTGVDLSQLPL